MPSDVPACLYCGKTLPPEAYANRRFCDGACRVGMKRLKDRTTARGKTVTGTEVILVPQPSSPLSPSNGSGDPVRFADMTVEQLTDHVQSKGYPQTVQSLIIRAKIEGKLTQQRITDAIDITEEATLSDDDITNAIRQLISQT